MMKGVTATFLRYLEEQNISAEDFFNWDKKELQGRLEKVNPDFLDSYRREEAMFSARKELDNLERHNIRCFCYGDDDYPWRLEDIPDAPLTLYCLGEADLNMAHPVGIVGTRRCTGYGVDFTRKFTAELGGYFPDLGVISGLAFGIDAAAHTAALENGLTTVAVVAHGLNTIYPAAHRDLAKRIIKEGGAIVSEYPFGTTPYRGRFLERNRIVAALSDAVVVMESEIKGGAMSTANTAFGYNREVFALPGRVSDPISAGCNHLISRNKAHLLSGAADIIEQTGWQPLGLNIQPGMRSLFPELQGDAKRIYDMLRFSHEPESLDNIHHTLRIPMPELMGLLGELEFDGVVVKLPGNRYEVGS